MKIDAGAEGNEVSVHSVATSFRILDELSAAGRPLRLTEIANLLGETKAKIHRHLTTLRQLGAVEQDLRLGPLGFSAIAHGLLPFNAHSI